VWRPKLVVRYGKGGRISSPTSTGGYVASVLLAFAFVAAFGLAGLSRKGPFGGADALWFGFLAFIVGRTLLDAWAWFASTHAEREEFRQYVANVRFGQDLRRPPGGGRTRSNWSNPFVLGLAAVVVACFALIQVNAAFIFAAMFALAFLVVVLLDRAREARRARGDTGSHRG
jgi:hypothetical protein